MVLSTGLTTDLGSTPRLYLYRTVQAFSAGRALSFDTLNLLSYIGAMHANISQEGKKMGVLPGQCTAQKAWNTGYYRKHLYQQTLINKL